MFRVWKKQVWAVMCGDVLNSSWFLYCKGASWCRMDINKIMHSVTTDFLSYCHNKIVGTSYTCRWLVINSFLFLFGVLEITHRKCVKQNENAQAPQCDILFALLQHF